MKVVWNNFKIGQLGPNKAEIKWSVTLWLITIGSHVCTNAQNTGGPFIQTIDFRNRRSGQEQSGERRKYLEGTILEPCANKIGLSTFNKNVTFSEKNWSGNNVMREGNVQRSILEPCAQNLNSALGGFLSDTSFVKII